MRIVWLGLLALALAGCGEIEKLQQARAAEERVNSFADLQDGVEALSPTAYDAMPTSGRARFDGNASITITPSNGSSALAILGDATLSANFGQGTLTGEVTNMRGASGTAESNAKLFDVGGRIVIGRDESQIGKGNGLTRPNDWRADFRGDLTTEPRGDWRIDGLLEGQFRGTDPAAANPANAIRAISGSSVLGTALRNDSSNDVTLDIVAQN